MDTKAAGALTAQRRKQLSLSQAERLHMTYKAVSRRETGRGMPGLDSLEPLSEALGLPVGELLSGTGFGGDKEKKAPLRMTGRRGAFLRRKTQPD